MVFQAIDDWESRGAGNAAVLVVDRGSREVVAAVSSSGYFDELRSGLTESDELLLLRPPKLQLPLHIRLRLLEKYSFLHSFS